MIETIDLIIRIKPIAMATPDTKTKILDAAENLFASQGFSATSLRNVIAEAGVNLAAIHYHFGSKERLIEAVFARRIGPLNARRLELLETEQLTAGDNPLPIEHILISLIHPVVEMARKDARATSRLTRLFGRIHSEPDPGVRTLLLAQFDSVRSRYLDALSRALPDLSKAELTVRFHFVIGAMAAAFADPKRLDQVSGGLVSGSNTVLIADYLIRFLSAGLRAQPSQRQKHGKHRETEPPEPHRRPNVPAENKP